MAAEGGRGVGDLSAVGLTYRRLQWVNGKTVKITGKVKVKWIYIASSRETSRL